MKDSGQLSVVSGQWPVRFVAVATTVRGKLDVPELLDDANQWRAFSAWREDESRRVRTEFELSYDDARVVWAKGSDPLSVASGQKKPVRGVDARGLAARGVA
jgi:hypothetical protein